MIHKMGLYEEYFKAIVNGKKKIEIRLNDEKRRKIRIGDHIEFIQIPSQNQTLLVEVTEIRSYLTFKEMYEDIPFDEFNCEDWTMEEMINGTYEIYTPHQEAQWGALAISIKLA